MTVIKRDGTHQDFDESKIVRAIKNANSKVSDKIDDEKIHKVVTSAITFIKSLKKDEVNVEEIHKAVEDALMKNNCFSVARQYIGYRQTRDAKRFKTLPIVGVMESKLFVKKNTAVHQNANLDEFSFGGKKGEMDSAFLKEHALNYYITPKYAKNHINNKVYIHDLDSYILGMHNCTSRETRFITDEGIKAFYEFKDGEKTNVLCKDGVFRGATVRYYGKKPLYDITFKRNNKEIIKRCTRDHRWILHDDTVTTNISVGDKIVNGEFNEISIEDIKSKRDAEMFAFGFIIGDGCDHGNYLTVRLCNGKNKYKSVFEKAGYHIRGVAKNGDVSYIKKSTISKQSFLSNKMWELLPLRDKQFLFTGYFAADGFQKSQISIATSDERCLSLIRDISALAGFHIKNEKTIIHSTNYKENATLYSVIFFSYKSPKNLWTVASIEKCKNKEYEAWCIEEPVTHSFVLEGGIVTGNCVSVPMDELLSSKVYTRQTMIRPAGSINTAFQLVAVYFQLQSLQQFGGVAATHLDWTLVPYVRKSFMKHFKDGLKYVEDKSDKEVEEIVKTIKGDKNREIIDISINDKEYKAYKKAWKYALDMTIKETNQAAEGMLHNLNSLQSRSGM